MKKSLDTYYCCTCGSDQIQVMAWVDANTNKYICDVNNPLEREDVWCEDCEEHSEIATLGELWTSFSNIPVNDEDKIEVDFLCFSKGTNRNKVLEWFDERCPNGIEKDLISSLQ